jgi:hypothetical protein
MVVNTMRRFFMDNRQDVPYIHDSGERQTFETGAVRDPSSGKGRYDLISPYATFRLALHYEAGAKKYEDRNWEKGFLASRCFDSAKRHLDKWLMGKTDEDHLAAAAWNVFAIMHFESQKPEMIDVGPKPAIADAQDAFQKFMKRTVNKDITRKRETVVDKKADDYRRKVLRDIWGIHDPVAEPCCNRCGITEGIYKMSKDGITRYYCNPCLEDYYTKAVFRKETECKPNPKG